MMTEEQQERAALYALGLLDADEAAEFEREMAADGELRALTDELREAAAGLARTDTAGSPPLDLKTRVLAHVSWGETDRKNPATANVIAGPWTRWVSWSVAAALAICCAWLAYDDQNVRGQSRGAVAAVRAASRDARQWEKAAQAAASMQNPLQKVAFCPLEPVPAAQQTGPQAAVLWDAAHRRGRLHITKLPSAGEGKDYELWTVKAGQKDPVSAGVVKVGADDVADVEFQPEGDDGKAQVVAFALSRERAGGVPKNEGPILFLGKLPN